MARRFFAALAVAVVALISVPTAAQASYAPRASIVITGDFIVNGTVNVFIVDGSFDAGEDVTFAVTGEGGVTIGALGAVTTATATKSATATGSASADVRLPATARGSYNVTATGNDSGVILSGAITVPAAKSGATSSSDGSLAATGADGLPMLLIWTAGGVLMLGIALVVVMNVVRRQRAGA